MHPQPSINQASQAEERRMMPPFPLPPLAVFIGYLSLFTLSLYLLSVAGRRLRAGPSKEPNLPPSPPKLPLLGNLHQLGSLPHRSLRLLSQKYGPLMHFHFGRVPTIVVSSASMAQELLKTHDQVFASRPSSTIFNKLFYDSRDVVFAPYGEYWRQVRRISVLHLLSLKRVQSFRSVRREEIAAMVGKIRASRGPVNLSEMLIGLTNDFVCRVAFGRKYSADEEGQGGGSRACELLTELVGLLGEFPVGDFIPWLSWLDTLSGLNARVEKTFYELDAFIDKVLDDHLRAERSHGAHDFVDVLLSLDDAKDDTAAISLSRNNIKAIILDMFTAGTDTTFAALEWTMTELIRHPEAMKRVQEEVREVTGLGKNVVEEGLDQMNYLKAVIKESMRLHPPAPLLVPRESTEDIKLCGYDIPARTRLIVNAWAIGRDPESWDRPEEFWPDRFMLQPDIDFKGMDFQFIPFGAGRRGCPGIGFAIPTIELALANMLHHFDWVMPDGAKGEGLNSSEKYGMTTHKKYSLILVAKPLGG